MTAGLPQLELLIEHIKAVRLRIPGLRGATAFVMVESNLGNEAYHHKNYLRAHKVRNVVIMEEDRGRVGFRTDNRMKQTMAMATGELLRRGQIRFNENMVVCDPKNTATSLAEKLVSQLRSFMRIVVKPNKPYHQPKVYFHGKFGSNKDDLSMCTMLNVEAEMLFSSNLDGKYTEYKT